ncbi:MAG: hypothetical protein AAFQ63_16430 [Cyanobacteria bacterium J06621_11]
MAAAAFKIVGKTRQHALSFASIKDFQLLECDPIAFEGLINNPYISLYSLDFETQRAVFVETPESLMLSEVPFYWLAQYEHAIQVITLPFPDFLSLARQISVEPGNLRFIYSVGRAGSTLASQIFTCVDNVEVISEPDALTVIVAARYAARRNDFKPNKQANKQADGQVDEQVIKALLAASVCFLCKSKTATQFVIKGRSQIAEIGDWLCELYPQAKNLFLYRDAESWLVSAKRAFTDGVQRDSQAQVALEQATRIALSCVTQLIANYPDDQHLSIVEQLVLTWLSAMDACMRMHNAGAEILPIRFSSWRLYPEETARRMLVYCDVQLSSDQKLREVLGRDSQANTMLAQAAMQNRVQRNEQGLLPSDIESLNYHLQRHHVVRSADFNIPATLSHAHAVSELKNT